IAALQCHLAEAERGMRRDIVDGDIHPENLLGVIEALLAQELFREPLPRREVSALGRGALKARKAGFWIIEDEYQPLVVRPAHVRGVVRFRANQTGQRITVLIVSQEKHPEPAPPLR